LCKFGTDRLVRLCKAKEISGREAVPVDECLAPLVQMLNDYGIETIACCCGHGKTSKSYIRIHSKNIQLIVFDDTLTVHLKFPYKEKHDYELLFQRKESPIEK